MSTLRLLPLALAALYSISFSAEVFEAALGRETELPGGKEADGIRGDFVLRNDKIEAVISHNSPRRRANMSTFYGDDGITPGLLYDLTLRGADNDQLVVYGPAGHGPVSYVRAVAAKEAGSAAVETVITAAKNGGLFKRHEYRVRDGSQGVFITTVLRNESDKPIKASLKEDLARFESQGDIEGGIRWMDAINPAHKGAYARATLSLTGAEKPDGDVEIAPGKEVVVSRFFSVGRSPAEAVGEALAAKGAKLATVRGSVKNADGSPITTASAV